MRRLDALADPILAADERGWTPIRKREQDSFIGVYLCSSAAGSAFAHFSGRLLALGKMFSYVLALSEDWNGSLLTSPNLRMVISLALHYAGRGAATGSLPTPRLRK
jgi:hypothetical protein